MHNKPHYLILLGLLPCCGSLNGKDIKKVMNNAFHIFDQFAAIFKGEGREECLLADTDMDVMCLHFWEVYVLWDHAFSLARIINPTDEDAEAFHMFILAAVSSSDLFWQEPQANWRATKWCHQANSRQKKGYQPPTQYFFLPLPSAAIHTIATLHRQIISFRHHQIISFRRRPPLSTAVRHWFPTSVAVRRCLPLSIAIRAICRLPPPPPSRYGASLGGPLCDTSKT